MDKFIDIGKLIREIEEDNRQIKCQAKLQTLQKVKEIIENKIKKPYAMVGGTVEANHIFREGRKQALREIVGRNNV